MSLISKITARKILDSRGSYTVEAKVHLTSGNVGVACVPEGKSKGENEAVSLPADEAVRNIEEKISPVLSRVSIENQTKIDKELLHLDGTLNKSNLGANALLAVSMASLKAASVEYRTFLWKRISAVSDMKRSSFPRLYANLINGGLHAGNNLPFQEYILIPKSNSPFESTNIIVSAYSNLREDLKRVYGPQATNVGDEGGFAPMLSDPISPYTLIENAVSNLGYKDIVEYGMDAAANNSGKSVSELFNIYEKMLNSHNIVYLEDPFSEKDEDSFQRITALFRHKVMISGDDITVTDKKRISRLSQKGAISAVIIKPNQIGTISEAIEAVKEARKNNISVVVSHRSGETNDDFIADFAVGVGADGIKLGAPARGERVSKYNRLLEIEREFTSGL